MSTSDSQFSIQCPLPFQSGETVQLAHGGGGRLSQQLLEQLIFPALRNPWLDCRHDGAILPTGSQTMAMTTDSYVVHPLFFPGGDIGSLAVHGTLNDLAMCGAQPLYLSLSFILEEGLSLETLRKVLESIRTATIESQVAVVTGDTKVVDRGKGDGIYINTTGLGGVPPGIKLGPQYVQEGDQILLSGPIGEHGIAILSAREGLQFETPVVSDSAALNGIVSNLLKACPDIHLLRDPTRGGVASVLNEIAQSAELGIDLEEDRIEVSEQVQGACEMLGLDPLYVANEGRFLAFVPPSQKSVALEILRSTPLGKAAQCIGQVTTEHPGMVVMKTCIGSTRVVDMLSGEQLPRIC